MALVGGGGAGNVAGSNPVGTGSGINYIGIDPTHAYAYSGVISVNNVETTLLLFSTGNQYILGQINFNTGSTSNDDYLYKIKLNGEIVQEYIFTGSPADRARPDNTIPILLPPYSQVELTATNVTDTSSNNQIVSVVGRVY
jgi:hypothetical protein